MIKYTLIIILILPCLGSTQWTIRPQVGMGLTDNANYDENNKQSDLFWWLGAFGFYQSHEAQWSGYLNYRDYARENQNDRLTYKLSRTESVFYPWSGAMDWQSSIGGQQYSGKSPAETEESFSHIFLDTSFAKSLNPGKSFQLGYGPGLQIKNFTDFDGRTDFTLYGEINADWEIRSDQSLQPMAEIGYVFSNQSEYSNTYIDLGAEWVYEPHPNWRYLTGASLRQTSYSSRSIAAATVITNRKGKVVSTTQSNNESHTLFQLQGTASYLLTKSELRAAILISQQNSRSGTLDFSERLLQFTYIATF